ncbi:hypothetical protein JCM19239_1483 [Vibrio variabilis]|uniref:Uncharacterized protein n=1 Tax=Vibrio variabilis TaxID=990271 RepID=A0ABQ0JG76_9VIBR|nr:hypothetical protein JCM19239_1483 [Vibrio variabilis]
MPVEVFTPELTKQEVKEGNGDLKLLMRLIKACLASPQPLGKPTGRQSQIAQSASLA